MALVLSAKANRIVNMMKEAGLSPNRPIAAAYSTMPGSATLRILQRSIMRPMTGTVSAEHIPPIDSANEAVPRCQPISAMIGFRKTPKVKPSTGPLQTNRPVTAPTTTHQGLVKRIPTASSLSALRATRARLPAILTRRAAGGDAQLGEGSPLIRMSSSGLFGGGQLPTPFEQVRLLLQVFGPAQPRFPDRRITSLLGELAIPRRQFPQLLWVFHCHPKLPEVRPKTPKMRQRSRSAAISISTRRLLPRGE